MAVTPFIFLEFLFSYKKTTYLLYYFSQWRPERNEKNVILCFQLLNVEYTWQPSQNEWEEMNITCMHLYWCTPLMHGNCISTQRSHAYSQHQSCACRRLSTNHLGVKAISLPLIFISKHYSSMVSLRFSNKFHLLEMNYSCICLPFAFLCYLFRFVLY